MDFSEKDIIREDIYDRNVPILLKKQIGQTIDAIERLNAAFLRYTTVDLSSYIAYFKLLDELKCRLLRLENELSISNQFNEAIANAKTIPKG